ncbi:Uncharacterised protein [Serratia marcescens]|nr:Uncharacterised protein [Serratia marcescens]
MRAVMMLTEIQKKTDPMKGSGSHLANTRENFNYYCITKDYTVNGFMWLIVGVLHIRLFLLESLQRPIA